MKEFGNLEIPLHLRNAPTQMMKQFGYGKNYAYAHDDLERAKQLKYLPDALGGKHYYEPIDSGTEKQLKENLARLRPHSD